MSHLYFRNKDVLSGVEDLETIYIIKNFPIFMGSTNENPEEDKFADMCFQISKSSGMVQLNPLVDLNLVYRESHNPGTIGQIWKKHHLALADFLLKFEKKSVLEIGGYSGILANNCLNINSEIKWTIVDPHAELVDSKIEIINSFFDINFSSNKLYDVVVHSHLIEHIIDINSFLKSCHNNLKEDGYMIFSFPNFSKFLKDRSTNCLHFEHTFFLDEKSLQILLNNNKFEVVEKLYYYEDNHIFYCVKKIQNSHFLNNQSNYLENKKLFEEYFRAINLFINNTNYLLKNATEVFIFGGHVTSQFLFAMGLNQKNIIKILDNDIKKQGKRLYGTDLIIDSPEILSNYNNPILILKNSIFDKEIEEQVLSVNPKTSILTF